MNLESLSEVEQLLTNLLSKSGCNCHFINSSKTRILMWKSEKNGQLIYHLRIGIQKFSSQEQIDRNGEIYWRYHPAESKEIIPNSELDPVTKFRQRQAKTEQINHAKSNQSEPSTTNSESN